jgi:hypothetical protein
MHLYHYFEASLQTSQSSSLPLKIALLAMLDLPLSHTIEKEELTLDLNPLYIFCSIS